MNKEKSSFFVQLRNVRIFYQSRTINFV